MRNANSTLNAVKTGAPIYGLPALSYSSDSREEIHPGGATEAVLATRPYADAR